MKNEFESPEPVEDVPNSEPRGVAMPGLLAFSAGMLAAVVGISWACYSGSLFGGEAVWQLTLLALILLVAIPIAGSMPLWEIRDGEQGVTLARRILRGSWYGFGVFFVLFACLLMTSFARPMPALAVPLFVFNIGLYLAAGGLQIVANLILCLKYRRLSAGLGLISLAMLWTAMGIGLWAMGAISASC